MIKFVETDSEAIISELVTQFETALGETLQPSDERRIFLNQLAQVVVGIKANINDTGNQVLLRTARGESLDAIGEMLGVTRLPASSAMCELEYTLSAVQTEDVTIRRGRRATPDGIVYFATTEDLIIPAGSEKGTVKAMATEAGAAYNGFVAGQIKYIVDNVSFVATVSNVTESSGGADEEDDESLRERIRLVPESFSTAGCEEGYEYWAKTASNDIGDVVVYSPVNDESLTETERQNGAGKVFVYILKADGSIPAEGDPLIDVVTKTVSAKDKRPLTDKVEVKPPETVEYSISLNYYISADDEVNSAEIQTRVAQAINEYEVWQGHKIGRDINPDKLRNLILNAGASRVVLTSPEYTPITATQVALCKGKTVKYAGLSE